MRTFAARHSALLLGLCVAAMLPACHRSDKSASGPRHFEVRGIVRGLLPDQKTINVEHEEIPGFMAAMTMPFTAKDPKERAALRVGDAISFRLTVTDQDSWIDQIKKINPEEVRLPARKTEPTPTTQTSPRLREGDPMPPFELTDQNGQTITLDTYRGRPFVVTFIFTRCPIPNFCPLMNKNFAELQNAIKSGSGPLAETRLLSISFDPENDTPAVLKEHAQREGADPAVWTFATGAQSQIKELTARFSVHVQPEAGTISHGLATALIDANGRIVAIWRGNGWKPDEVVGRVADANAQPFS